MVKSRDFILPSTATDKATLEIARKATNAVKNFINLIILSAQQFIADLILSVHTVEEYSKIVATEVEEF